MHLNLAGLPHMERLAREARGAAMSRTITSMQNIILQRTCPLSGNPMYMRRFAKARLRGGPGSCGSPLGSHSARAASPFIVFGLFTPCLAASPNKNGNGHGSIIVAVFAVAVADAVGFTVAFAVAVM